MAHLKCLTRQTVGAFRAFSEVYLVWKRLTEELKREHSHEEEGPSAVCCSLS